MNYVRDYPMSLITHLHIFNNAYYIYDVSSNSIIRYNRLLGETYDTVLSVQASAYVIDYYVSGSSIFLVINDIISMKYTINYIEVKDRINIIISSHDIDVTNIFSSFSNISKLIVLDKNNFIFNLSSSIIYASFTRHKIKKQHSQVNQSRGLLHIQKIVKFEDLLSLNWSSALDDVLVLDDQYVLQSNEKILFRVTDRFQLSISISNYFIYAIEMRVVILRKSRGKWQGKKVIKVDKDYIVTSLAMKDMFLYVLAVNYRILKSRLYMMRVKNVYLDG